MTRSDAIASGIASERPVLDLRAPALSGALSMRTLSRLLLCAALVGSPMTSQAFAEPEPQCPPARGADGAKRPPRAVSADDIPVDRKSVV